MINREKVGTTASTKELDNSNSEFFIYIIAACSIVVIVYVALYMYFGAYLSAFACTFTAFFTIPLILYLQKKGQILISKLLTVTSSALLIGLTGYGLRNQAHTEYYFLPAIMFSLLLFEPTQKKAVLFAVVLPFISWIAMEFCPTPLTPGWLFPDENFPYYYFSIFNFLGAFSLTYIFLHRYSGAITQVKKIELENEQKLMTASKISSLGELASGIAHEINNPLSVIIGRTQLLKNKLEGMSFADKEADVCMQSLNKIEDTAQLITRIVKGLNAFSRDSDSDPMLLQPLNQIIKYAAELCDDRIKSHSIRLTINYKCDLTINCRDVQIVQVLANLIGNAIDAIEKLEDRWIEINVTEIKNNAVISVLDSGTGIPVHLQEKIMQPFFSTKVTGKGIGLGLSISKGITESHGGRLSYDAGSPHTHFKVELPIR